ncbi:MAG TPA: DUF3093 domain-containing protein [Rhodoglobus sp.]|nr:DUF3093 domain-containing protein [Rhodoglobus sp.]
MDAVPRYRERLWPAPWLFVATALVIPASLLVFTPIELWVGVVVGIVLYAGVIGLLLAGSPRIEVTDDELLAGRARIPLRLLGTAEAARGEDAFAERGPRADARAWMLVRGWVDPVVRVPVEDPEDPAPYWLLSTRRPDELAAALNARD